MQFYCFEEHIKFVNEILFGFSITTLPIVKMFLNTIVIENFD